MVCFEMSASNCGGLFAGGVTERASVQPSARAGTMARNLMGAGIFIAGAEGGISWQRSAGLQPTEPSQVILYPAQTASPDRSAHEGATDRLMVGQRIAVNHFDDDVFARAIDA